MKNLTEIFRRAFPSPPIKLLKKNRIVLSEAYLRKCGTYFDFSAMYPESKFQDRNARKKNARVNGARIR